jgi:tetratricopeptide (TPR) repeat protein
MGSLDEAVAGLDDAMRLLGAIPSLELAAIDYERRQQHFEGALGRLAGMIRRYPLKEPWLALRGELLEEAGRYSEAEAAYGEVVQGLEKYPPHRRNVLLNKELSERAREGLRRVKERRTTQTVSTPEAER